LCFKKYNLLFFLMWMFKLILRGESQMLCKYSTTDDGKIFTEADFRKILGLFFKGDPLIMNAEPSDQMVEILWEAVSTSRDGAKAFSFVPQPTGSPPGAAYIAGIFVRTARELSRPKDKKGSLLFQFRSPQQAN
jgi:hypothetical protein